MKYKNLTHIRISKEDKEIWKEYCKILNEPSHKLFNKILHSEKLNLENRIQEEYQKKIEKFKRLKW